MNPNNTNTQTLCDHCGDTCSSRVSSLGDKVFCCEGCKSVYQLLNEYNLCTYYELNDHPGNTQKINIRKDKFAFLDDPEIAPRLIQFNNNASNSCYFLFAANPLQQLPVASGKHPESKSGNYLLESKL